MIFVSRCLAMVMIDDRVRERYRDADAADDVEDDGDD